MRDALCAQLQTVFHEPVVGPAASTCECFIVVVYLIVIPWGDVFANYVLKPGDYWRSAISIEAETDAARSAALASKEEGELEGAVSYIASLCCDATARAMFVSMNEPHNAP